MDVHKKNKPRQRNRPKNKANRLQDAKNKPSEYVEQKIECVPSQLQLQTENASCLRYMQEKSSITASPQQSTASTNDLAQNEAAIKLIQQLFRAKLLKQSEPKQTHLTDVTDVIDTKTNSKETLTSNCKELNVKKSKSKDVTDIKTNSQETLTSNCQELNVKKSKSKEKITESKVDKDAFIAGLKQKMESIVTNEDNADLPQTLLSNLQKLFSQEPISDVESSDDEEEYIEYIYKPRQYFLVSLCNLCKCDLSSKKMLQCTRCKMTYYCSPEHMKCDDNHRQLCYALQQVADSSGTHLFYKCGDFTTEQFRSYRIVTIRKVEAAINRPLTASEQEVILFPRICANVKCREYRFNKLSDCADCGQIAFCKSSPEHFNKQHHVWCKPYQLFKKLIVFQEKFGHLNPSLPTKILKDIPGACCTTKQIFSKLALDLQDQCEYAARSQISTCPLTAWYALKLCDQLKKTEVMTIHLIGAEIEFEVDVMHKWELFFLHITPLVKLLNVVFIGPELNPRKISFEQFKKTKCCRSCRKNERTVNYYFENNLYHDYCKLETFLKPDLVCFFNAGLYRSTGYHLEDTWPETILAASNLKCPVVVTSYTEYEAPLDMSRFVQESNRRLNVVLPPIINPFASVKPERNFISDEDAPLMFKNYYCFVVE